MKNQKPIPAWAIGAAKNLDYEGWLVTWVRDKEIKKIARGIADAYENGEKAFLNINKKGE